MGSWVRLLVFFFGFLYVLPFRLAGNEMNRWFGERGLDGSLIIRSGGLWESSVPFFKSLPAFSVFRPRCSARGCQMERNSGYCHTANGACHSARYSGEPGVIFCELHINRCWQFSGGSSSLGALSVSGFFACNPSDRFPRTCVIRKERVIYVSTKSRKKWRKSIT